MQNFDKNLKLGNLQCTKINIDQQASSKQERRFLSAPADTVSFKGVHTSKLSKVAADKAKALAAIVGSLVTFKLATADLKKEDLSQISAPEEQDYPIINGLKPQFISDEEANKMALELGLTDAEINQLRAKYQNFNAATSAIKIMAQNSLIEDIDLDFFYEILAVCDNKIKQKVFNYLTEENLLKVSTENALSIDRAADYIIDEVVLFFLRQKEPELISLLEKININTADGNTERCYNKNDYIPIAEAYAKNKDLTERLVNIHPFCKKLGIEVKAFDGDLIYKLVSAYETSPELVEIIIKEITDELAEMGFLRRFYGCNVSRVFELYKQEPELVKRLVQEQDFDSYSKKYEPRFDIPTIKEILEYYSEAPEFIEQLLQEKSMDNPKEFRYSGKQISKLIKTREKNPEAYDYLMNITHKVGGKTVPYALENHILKMIEFYEKDFDFLKNILSRENESGEKIYSAYAIVKLFESYEKNQEITKRLMDMTSVDYQDKVIPRFHGQEIAKIVDYYQQYPEFTEEILNMRELDNSNYRFDAYHISSIIEAYAKAPEFVTKSINSKVRISPREYKYRFSGSEIKQLAESYNEYPTLLESIIEMKSNNGVDYRFLDSQISKLMKLAKEDSDFLEELLNEKGIIDQYGTEGFIYTFADIVKLFNKFKNNKAAYSQAKNWITKNRISFCIDDILALYPTQQRFYSEAAKLSEESQKVEPIRRAQVQSTTVKSVETTELESRLVEIGLHPRMAENYVKLCHINGIVDKAKADSIYKLIKAYTFINEKGKLIVGISPKDVENIFDLALANQMSTQNGSFRADLIDDIIKLKASGVEDIKLAINISAILNMDKIELKSRINTKVRQDVVNRFEALPKEVLEELETVGLTKEVLNAKAALDSKSGKVNKENAPQTAIVRSLDSIVGVEKVVLNKFKSEIPQEIWSNPESFKAWAEQRLAKLLNFEENPDFIATGQYARYNKARKDGIESWYKFLVEESNYKDDVFVHLLVIDGITREMKPNNAYTPPAVSHEEFEATYNALLEAETKISFSKIYAQQLRAKAVQKYTTEVVSLNGIEGEWVTIPRTQKGEPNYDENIAMVQALSEGSSWCLRFENAHTYLQQGNLHFFVDKRGFSQVAINETDGVITQIQKRYDQNSTVPVPYSEVISLWAKKNKYTGKEVEINKALEIKPKFDEMRSKVQELMAKKDYEGVFRLLNITYKIIEDGTYSIDGYRPKYNPNYTLHDLGINENDLLSNVSCIEATYGVDFTGSNLTALPKLKKITRIYDWGDCKITDLSSLEEIGNNKIYWEK